MTRAFMTPTMRWFGPKDCVSLADIAQAGAEGVVTALHELPCGNVWPKSLIEERKAMVERAGLRWLVVESVPVHEQIKRGDPGREAFFENYRHTLRNLASAGVTTVCYNFMAVTDWTRTNLAMKFPNGAEALRFDAVDCAVFDLFLLKRPGAEAEYSTTLLGSAFDRHAAMSESEQASLASAILMGLPGTVDDLTVEAFRREIERYRDIDSEALRQNHAEFLQAVIPTAEQHGVRMALHPDDPPFPLFGLPRVACTLDDLQRVVRAVPSPSNGLTFCTGSLGARAENDLPMMLATLADHVHFLHLRNVRRENDGSFFEDTHLGGDVDMFAVIEQVAKVWRRTGRQLPMRPDHGHRMGDDLRRDGFYAGYSFVGRLKGLAELQGVAHAIARRLER